MFVCTLQIPDGGVGFHTTRGLGRTEAEARIDAIQRFVIVQADDWYYNACTDEEQAAVVALGEALEAGDYDRVPELFDALGTEVFIDVSDHGTVDEAALEAAIGRLLSAGDEAAAPA